jgi:hypothetical protein
VLLDVHEGKDVATRSDEVMKVHEVKCVDYPLDNFESQDVPDEEYDDALQDIVSSDFEPWRLVETSDIQTFSQDGEYDCALGRYYTPMGLLLMNTLLFIDEIASPMDEIASPMAMLFDVAMLVVRLIMLGLDAGMTMMHEMAEEVVGKKCNKYP